MKKVRTSKGGAKTETKEQANGPFAGSFKIRVLQGAAFTWSAASVPGGPGSSDSTQGTGFDPSQGTWSDMLQLKSPILKPSSCLPW